ncbi:uncharacterized protein LOC100114369 isoform X1 [Nasonia vitripennis]|uniref:Exonuclease domain-containing protein n=2 Tax=Nasonia vitripennis TaxID=7425 RepID=A0A7M7QGU4_NASVI|nr:uncharacterized protein LOC100114369 isoform X1 [Nasonia vitripennis]
MRLLLRNKGAFRKIFKTDPPGKCKMTAAGEELYNKIDTFVFFDLETSDLIKGHRMPRITELSMVATDRNSLKNDMRDKLALPRIMHKLTIPICPNAPIHQEASFASNLWNDSLEHFKPFDKDTYNMIMLFINRLPGVICFVAHNGNRFDYPVFLSEIDKLQMTFPDRILCVDTLIAFKEFFSDAQPANMPPIPVVPIGVDEVDEEELEQLSKQDPNASLDDEWNDSLCSVVDELEKVRTKDSVRTSLSCGNGKDVLDAITNKKQQADGKSSGSTTPKSSPKSMQAVNEKTPENQIIKNSRKTLNGVRKQLNFGNAKPKNFQLSTVYSHMIGCEAKNLHSAEGDCISMLTCVCQMGPHFAQWADYNAVSLNLFKK